MSLISSNTQTGALRGCAKNFYNLAVRFEVMWTKEEKINEEEVVHHVRLR